jgi:16S rRNA (guanine966-N2)-methyltransferase
MRITGGTLRSRLIEAPKEGVRPTSDKVRQAIFNMLNARGAVVDAIVLDAFSGSGALGLEALSQGAEFCTFWDKSPESIRYTRGNIQNLGMEEQSLYKSQNATTIGPKPEFHKKFTLVFLDPPYRMGLITLAIEALHKGGWIDDECLFVLEMAVDENPEVPGLDVVQDKSYGDTKVWLAYNVPE